MKYQPISVPDLNTPAKKLQFHAACIDAARQGNDKGICRTCFSDAASVLGPQPSVTAKYENVMGMISLYSADGAIDLHRCYDDGGRFDQDGM